MHSQNLCAKFELYNHGWLNSPLKADPSKWKINWAGKAFDELERVYGKAEKDKNIKKLMEQLETKALSEMENITELLMLENEELGTREPFAVFNIMEETTGIEVLAESGLVFEGKDISNRIIAVRFNSNIQNVLACTIFEILNYLEALDGLELIRNYKWTLKLQVPLGGKKGLIQWEMLMMQLYPWLLVEEISTNEVVTELQPSKREDIPYILRNTKKEMKKEMLAEKLSDTREFLLEMEKKHSFHQKYAYAKIFEIWHRISYQGKKVRDFIDFKKIEVLNFILSIGYYAISVDSTVKVDYVETFPNCIAITLMYAAWRGDLEEQLIDAGTGVELEQFVEALSSLYKCCDEWECTIIRPLYLQIGESIDANIYEKIKKITKKRSVNIQLQRPPLDSSCIQKRRQSCKCGKKSLWNRKRWL